MGTFDSIYIDNKILQKFKITCPSCKEIFVDSTIEFQTKSLYCCMDEYYLKYDDKNIRLYELDDPTDKKYWHRYTEEELEEHNTKEDHLLECGIMPPLYRYPGDGYWIKEAFYPENRTQISMGNFPHQWITIYSRCPHCCRGWIEVEIKFTDGIVCEIERTEARDESF